MYEYSNNLNKFQVQKKIIATRTIEISVKVIVTMTV